MSGAPERDGQGPAEAETKALLEEIHTPPNDPLGRLVLRLACLIDTQAVVQRGGEQALAARIVEGLRADDGLRKHYRDVRWRDVGIAVVALATWTVATATLTLAYDRFMAARTATGPMSERSSRILRFYGGPDGFFDRGRERAVTGGGVALDLPPSWVWPPPAPPAPASAPR